MSRSAYSGSNFERPAFQRLFRELEQGTINCVLVKDLSRFGRNYIEVGRYLERIFPVMRVRLIAVTDNYDSQSAWKTSDSIMVPMRNLLNDAYCRDISVKIKSQLAVKRKRGDFVGSFATYGYQKDPSNHTKLIVDELAAETVQDIFRWKISGMNNQNIADRLNAKKVPSPAARKLQSGAKLSLHFRKSDEPPWSAKAVDRILHNEVYIGKLVQGKTRRLDYRSKKKMNVPIRDWVIVDNTHEAIISAEQFELVQRILETETRRPNDAETVALFAGFLYCGDCGSRLVRRSASYKGKRYIYYQCSSSKQNKGSCTSHNLRDEKLYNIVRNALQMQIQIVMEEAEFVESIRQAQQEPYRVRRIERQIRQLTAEKAHTQGIKEKLYGDYAEEILTREDFLNYNELYSKRIEEYDRKITELEAERQNLQTTPNAYPFLDVYCKYRKLEEITRPMVVELIEKIEVYEGNRVEITFREIYTPVPFGYKRNQQNHLILDEEVSDVVVRIFLWKKSGMKEREIAKKLSAQGIQTPFTRRCQLGYLKNTLRVKDPAWQTVFVTKVLENPIYTGTMVYNRIAYDETYRKIGENPRESWRMVPDNHPAIISWELFDEVSALREDEQAVKEERKKWCRQRRKNNPNIFKGRIFCKKCGEKLVCHWQSDGTLYFYCASCHVSISEKDLWNGINKELHQRMEEHRDLQKLVRKSSGKSKLQSKEITTKRKIEQVMGNVVRLESQKRSGYEQYVLGKLSKEKFLELKQGLENEITTLKQTKAEKEKELAVVQEELQRKKQIAGSTEVLLTADNLQQYVKKIEVDRGKITYTEFLL